MAQGIIRENIVKAFGRGFPLSSIISSASLVVLCLFYVYSAATYAHLIVYPLIDRVTYYTVFGVYITNEYVDHVILGSLLVVWQAASLQKSNKTVYYIAVGISAAFLIAAAVANSALLLEGVALASLPAIVALLLYKKYSAKKILKNHQQQDLTLNYFGILGIILGLIGLAFAIASVASSNVAAPIQPVRNYAYDVFVVLSSFSPVLILLLIACIPIKLIVDFALRTLKIRPMAAAAMGNDRICKKHLTVFLSLIVSLSIIFTIIPHLPTINPDGQSVGVDTSYYLKWVTNMANSSNVGEFLHQAFVQQNGGDRPILLMFLYALQKLTSAPLFYVIEYLPVILGPALILAVFFFTRELVENDTVSILASFLTAVSFHTLIGIYAAFYANWFALVFGYLSFLFLFRFLKNGNNKNLVLYGALLVTTLLTHVYTWSILAIVGGIFLAGVLIKGGYRFNNGKKSATLLLMVLIATVVIDLGRSTVGSTVGIERDLQLAGDLAGPEQFVARWNNLTYTVTAFVGGQFSNFIILAFGLYWLISAAAIRNTSTIFLLIFMSIGILPFLFGDWIIQTRVFYDIPFQIPAAIALANIASRVDKKEGQLRAIPIYIWLIMISILAVSNYYLKLPSG